MPGMRFDSLLVKLLAVFFQMRMKTSKNFMDTNAEIRTNESKSESTFTNAIILFANSNARNEKQIEKPMKLS